MKNILVPTDFSPASQHAFEHVFKLFDNPTTPLRITLLNTYLVPPVENSQLVSANDQMKQEALDALRNEKERIAKLLDISCIEIKLVAYMGSVENVIPHILAEDNYDMVVMGKNGGDYINRVSKALKSMNSTCPLMIAYPPAKENLRKCS